MLFLRRRQGEAIAIFDARVEVWVKVMEIDVDAVTALLEITGYDDPVELRPGDTVPILQGEGNLRLDLIQEIDGEREEIDGDTASYCNLGLSTPRSLNIYRGELLRGTTREQRRGMVRTLNYRTRVPPGNTSFP